GTSTTTAAPNTSAKRRVIRTACRNIEINQTTEWDYVYPQCGQNRTNSIVPAHSHNLPMGLGAMIYQP
ncbi:MAG TPA: hypothetical protein VGZ25_07870, partial [Gemmataceae bacterium]|nr:hypothetical protein [Gemmataceae bacterium]